MAGTQSVRSIYQSVVDDVISGVREVFLDEGVDEQVLTELKQLWENKVMQSKSVEPTPVAPVHVPAEQQLFAPHPNSHKVTTQQQNLPKYQQQQRVPQHQQQRVQQQQQPQQQFQQQQPQQQLISLFPHQLSQQQQSVSEPQQQQQQLMSQQQPPQMMSQPYMIPAAAHKPLPVPIHTGVPQPAHQPHNIHQQQQQQQQQQPVNLQQGVYSLAHQQQISGAAQTAILSLPGGMLQQHLAQAGGPAQFTVSNGQLMHITPVQRGVGSDTTFYTIGQHTIGQQGVLQLSQADLKSDQQQQQQHLQQLDGVGDSSSDEEEEEEDDDEDEAPEELAGEEEEPLNSGDDVSDADPTEVFDAENVVVCQFDKINRCKNKWKFHLKDGIMNLNGKDYVFQKATGDAEW